MRIQLSSSFQLLSKFLFITSSQFKHYKTTKQKIQEQKYSNTKFYYLYKQYQRNYQSFIPLEISRFIIQIIQQQSYQNSLQVKKHNIITNPQKMQSEMKPPTKKQLEQRIITQKLSNNKQIFYSQTKKQRNMMGSVFPKDTILIFSPQDNSLYYVKQGVTLPFLHQANISKAGVKDIADVNRSTYSNPTGTAELVIKYPKKDQKGKQETIQWKFDMANKGIAQSWVEMLNKHKEKYLNQNLNNNPKTNPSVINNYQPNNNKQFDPMQFLLTDSKIILNKQQNQKPKPEPLKPQQNPIKPTEPDPKLISSIYSNNVNPNPQPKPSLQQSRLSYAYGATSRIIGLNQSRIKPQNQSNLFNDWNFKFVKNPTRDTVYQFEKVATNAFFNVYNDSRNENKSFIRTNVGQFNIKIADIGTKQCKKLKNQYRNYDYILQCCKLQAILSVPLACLIQYCGSVGLVKAKLPAQAPKLKNKRQAQQLIGQLQQRTKITNSIFFNNQCSFYDLTKIYGSYGQSSRIYVDDLEQYMPEFSSKPKQKQDIDSLFYIRPQLMQYFQNRIMPGGNIQSSKNNKAQAQFSAALESQIKDIADCLNNQQIYITNIFDLKEFLHFRGVNMKFLYKIYQETKNKFVKRYLQTCLVAKIIKDAINMQLNQLAKQPKKLNLEQCAQDQIRYFIQGKTATANQYWKRITLQYRNLYGTTINTHELIGGFLLSCIITLIPGRYNIDSIDKQKTIFKDQGIINKGFVKKLQPKIKSFYKFDMKISETAEICKYSEKKQEIYRQLVQYMNLNSKQIPQYFNVNKSRPYVLGYLSDFIAPEGLAQQRFPCAKQIYSLVNLQPPSVPSLKVTQNYIKQYINAVKNQKIKTDQQFQSLIRESVQIINFWLQVQHPRICQFYQKISTYQEYCGNTEQSLQILEKAIQIANKTQAKNTKKIGTRHYIAGCQYLKSGKKKEAIDNLQKAKACMEKSQGQQSQYALVLLKLSSLQLNSGDTQSCIKYGKQALKNSQKGKMSDVFSIKIYEILCRAYQIKGQKQQLRKLGLMCSKQFNRTQQKAAFSQMIKICLTGTMSRLSFDRSKSLLSLVQKLKQDNRIKDQNQSLYSLMQRAKSGVVVMQNFMMKADNAQKYLNEYIAKKQLTPDANEFILTLGFIGGCVGIDFIEGLHDQKEFQ